MNAEVDLGFHIKINERFRILGIDVPTISGVTKDAGLKSKQYLINNLLNKDIVLVSTKLDEFRRYLADVYITNADGLQSKLADFMLEFGLANLIFR